MRSTLIATLLTCAGLATAHPASACDDAKATVVSAGSTGAGASATVTSSDGKTVVVCNSDGASTFTVDTSGAVKIMKGNEPTAGNRIVIVSPDGKTEHATKAKAFKVVIDGDREPEIIELSPDDMATFWSDADGEVVVRATPRAGARVFGGDKSVFAFAGPRGEGRAIFRGPRADAPAQPDRPRLGVMLDESEDGLIIHNVMENMPAAKAGLAQGDVIVEINGASPANMDRLRKVLGASEMKVTVLRDGEEKEVTVKLGVVADVDGPRWRMREEGGPAHAPRWRMRDGDADEQGKHEVIIRKRADEKAVGDEQRKHEVIIRKRAEDAAAGEVIRKRLGELGGRIRSLDSDQDIVLELREGLEEARKAMGDLQLKMNFDLDLDPETLEHVRKALKDAMANVEVQIDTNVRKALEDAQVRLRRIDPGQFRAVAPRGEGRGEGWVRADQGRAERERRAIMERRLAEAEAERHLAETRPHARENAIGPRNRDLDARLKSLEERMERIEAMLRRLDRQG